MKIVSIWLENKSKIKEQKQNKKNKKTATTTKNKKRNKQTKQQTKRALNLQFRIFCRLTKML